MGVQLLAHVVISWVVGSSPTAGSMISAESASLPLPPPLPSLSRIIRRKEGREGEREGGEEGRKTDRKEGKY